MICLALQHASLPPLLFHFLVYGEGEGGDRRGIAGEGGRGFLGLAAAGFMAGERLRGRRHC